ncbi:MAG: hypothetical protein ACYDCC_09180 [Actinomycetota bacterium]
MTRPMRPKLITPDTLKAVDREYRDLVMSLRALAALLHDVDPDHDDDKAWEPVLANILDAELSQLSVLMGDVTAALRMENEITGPVRRVDLTKAVESAIRKTGSRVLMRVSEPVRVAAHPDIVSQSVASAISLALRIADGRVTLSTRHSSDEGVVTIGIPTSEDHAWSRWESRFALLRKIVSAEGGRISVEHRPAAMTVRLFFRSVFVKRSADSA